MFQFVLLPVLGFIQNSISLVSSGYTYSVQILVILNQNCEIFVYTCNTRIVKLLTVTGVSNIRPNAKGEGLWKTCIIGALVNST